MAIAFLPLAERSEQTEVNHKDFNKQNNHYTNLEWCCTPLENVHHSKRAGRLRNGTTKLTEDDVRAIRARHASGMTYVQLAAEYGIAFGSIGKLIRGERWSSVQ